MAARAVSGRRCAPYQFIERIFCVKNSDKKNRGSFRIGTPVRIPGIDFAAILDHRQVRHMYQPVWQDGLFIPGTEPAAVIDDWKAQVNQLHYNMLFGDRDERKVPF